MRNKKTAAWAKALLLAVLVFCGLQVLAATTDIATSPVVTNDNSGSAVKPNLMFILDDSGSMDWDFLPDWANDYYCKNSNGRVDTSSSSSVCCRNRSGGNDACMYMSGSNTDFGSKRGDVPFMTSDINRAYYNPAIRYTPPVNADGTSKPSQTSANTSAWASVKLDAYGIQHSSSKVLNLVSAYPDGEWCTDNYYTDCFKNTGNYLLPNSTYSVFHPTVGNAYYYVITAGEYCKDDKLTDCTVTSTATGDYTYPAKLRWCSDTALTTCQAIKNANFKYPRYPMIYKSGDSTNFVQVTISGSTTDSNNKTESVTGVTVATGAALLTSATTTSNNVDSVAQAVISGLTNGYIATPRRCTTSGSTRTCTFLIYAPYAATPANGSVSITKVDGAGPTAMTFSVTGGFNGNVPVPGSFARIDILSGYVYWKAPTRTDCVASSCTYDEEMTNFANWYTYYRTRMQMMKSASSLAFSGVYDNFRVGYLSINANASNSFLNVATFDSTQKTNWYAKLFAANPNNGTPLRSALSTAGLIYGGVLTGNTLNGVTVEDPIQYSCQKNFAILSTDGYWNTGNDSGCSGRNGAGCKLDTTSAVGNADGVAQRPYADGASVTVKTVTPMTTVTRQQSDQGQTTTTPWTRSVVTNGGACTAFLAPAGSCLQDNGKNSSNSVRTWCMETGTSKGSQCTSAFGTASPNAYACRGTSNSTNKPGGVDTGCVTDGAGVQWCLYGNNSTAGTSNCSVVLSGNSLYVCKRPAVAGTNVTTVTQTYNQVQSQTRSVVTDAAATYNRTVITTNGVVTSDTNGATTTTTSTVSNNTVNNSDTGAPAGGTTWATTGSTTTCMASPTAPGTSAAVAGSPTTVTTGTATVTVVSVNGPTAGTPTVTSSTSGGTSDTLADVAYYYYNTDLRPAGSTNPSGVDVGTGDYDAANGAYTNNIQRMATYTLGLGVDGYMKFRPDYMSASSGDYYDIANGATSTATRCTWQSVGAACNWPTPSSDSQANIDDLWHAAVNGRGQYFSAGDPAALAAGLSGALSSISAKLGAAAAATTSTPNITPGDNFLFSSQFMTGDWTGSLQRLQIDPVTGNVVTTGSPPVPQVDWDAQSTLDAKVGATSDSRAIYMATSDTGNYANGLKPFVWSAMTAAEQSYFMGANLASLPQFCATGTYSIAGIAKTYSCLASDKQTDAAGEKLVNFLRGQNGFEDRAANATVYYRNRTHVLGDIVSSEAVYVKKPLANYVDAGFNAFKLAQTSNQGMVYVSANDGMLHAFDSETGQERWAFVPSMVLPKMYSLASMNYRNDHKFLVDGSPVVDYAYFDGSWKTLLIGGLGAGGAGYYALDITDPTAPKWLWEFKRQVSSCASTVDAAIGQTSDCDLGFSFGNPVVTKLQDGTWVVLITSGYNNNNSNNATGSGQGYLYALNPKTGAIIRKISTGVGSDSTISGVCSTAPCPSGVAKIAAWVDQPDTDNTTKRVYGGDLFGNLWRFDINGNIGATGYDAQQLAVLKGPSGSLQPITARPELGEINGIPVVMVGTGKLLGDSDKSDPLQQSSPTNNKQSFYAIKDPLTASSWGNARTSGLIQQTVTITSDQSRQNANTLSVNWATVPGWFLDLPDNGERANTDPSLVLGTIVFSTNVPVGSACSSSGQSFEYNLDYRTGTAVSGAAGIKLGNSLATRPVVIQLSGGAVRSLIRLGDASTHTTDVKIGSASTAVRRVSWRQLVGD